VGKSDLRFRAVLLATPFVVTEWRRSEGRNRGLMVPLATVGMVTLQDHMYMGEQLVTIRHWGGGGLPPTRLGSM
jgi:hypothetical protein